MTVRRSPQTERLVDVIELLGDPPGNRYSLTEISVALGLDKTTLYPMLVELTRVGWIVKHPTTKNYRLGPALVRIGRAAEESVAELAATARAISTLAERTGQTSCVVVPSGKELVVAGVQTPENGGRSDFQLKLGDRVAFCPPLGAALVAWAGEAAVDGWLNRTALGPDQSSRYREILSVVRRRHYAAEQFPPAMPRFHEMAATATGSRSYGSRRAAEFTEGQQRELGADVLVGAIDDTARYRPMSISAPIFGATGQPVGSLSVLDHAEPVSGVELAELGEFVSSVADEVTAQSGGRTPYR